MGAEGASLDIDMRRAPMLEFRRIVNMSDSECVLVLLLLLLKDGLGGKGLCVRPACEVREADAGNWGLLGTLLGNPSLDACCSSSEELLLPWLSSSSSSLPLPLPLLLEAWVGLNRGGSCLLGGLFWLPVG